MRVGNTALFLLEFPPHGVTHTPYYLHPSVRAQAMVGGVFIWSEGFMIRPPIHPGKILADELHELHMSAAELSRTLHVPTNHITQILSGMQAITADTALRLGQWLGTGPEFWLNLQKSYELRLTEQEDRR